MPEVHRNTLQTRTILGPSLNIIVIFICVIEFPIMVYRLMREDDWNFYEFINPC